jgi:integrase
MILRLSNSLKLHIKYCFLRGDILYWQRKVPKDLEDRYGGPKLLKINLKTADLNKAAKQVDRLNKAHEASWDAMRDDAALTPASVKVHALLLLKKWGLAPYSSDNDEAAVDQFIEKIFQDKREKLAGELVAKESGDPDTIYAELGPEHYATPVEVKALELLTQKPKFLLSDAVLLYLDGHKKKNDETFRKYTNRTWDKLIATLGDKPFAETKRVDANRFRDAILDGGSKTTTAQRLLKVIAAVFAAVIKEQELERTNPFSGVSIGGLGEDAEEREPFTNEQLRKVSLACLAKDDDMRWLLALQTDLGSRLSEVVGLALDDLMLDAEIPHVVFKAHPWRSLKNANSKRKVPLTGIALWAAKRIKESATASQQMAFPRYCTIEECKGTSASNSLNDWIRGLKVDNTTHACRHTMADRLREVGCPEDIRKVIGGWSKDSLANEYGDGHSLRIKREWMDKVVLADLATPHP